jgi:cytochrome b561
MVAELIPKEGESVNLFLRSLYLSVVTMTTLGFGDMHAAQGSVAGHILLMIHVITGYVILAALIVRLGILFTSVPSKHKEVPKIPSKS